MTEKANKIINDFKATKTHQIRNCRYPDITPSTARHELYGFMCAMKEIGLIDDAECIVMSTEFSMPDYENKFFCMCNYSSSIYELDFEAGDVCTLEDMTEDGCHMISNIHGKSVFLTKNDMERFFKALF